MAGGSCAYQRILYFSKAKARQLQTFLRRPYCEATKFTAKLRRMKTDDNFLMLKANMGAGHGGASGRYDRLKDVAIEYAFLLSQMPHN